MRGTTISFRIFRLVHRLSQGSWLEPTRKGKFHELKHDECAASVKRTTTGKKRKIDSARLSLSLRISCDRSSNSHLRPLPPSIHHRRLSTYPPRRLQTRSITVFARSPRQGKIVGKPRVIHQSNAILVDLVRKIRRPPLSPRELDDEGLSLTLGILRNNDLMTITAVCACVYVIIVGYNIMFQGRVNSQLDNRFVSLSLLSLC